MNAKPYPYRFGMALTTACIKGHSDDWMIVVVKAMPCRQKSDVMGCPCSLRLGLQASNVKPLTWHLGKKGAKPLSCRGYGFWSRGSLYPVIGIRRIS